MPLNFKQISTHTEEGWELRIRVIPGASRTELAGMLGDRLKIRVSVAPEKGKANKAVIELLKKETGVKEILIKSGSTSQDKTLLLRE